MLRVMVLLFWKLGVIGFLFILRFLVCVCIGFLLVSG